MRVAQSDVHLRLSASLLWSQRHNPAWLEVPTFVAAFRRSSMDTNAWESTDGQWTAELRRTPRGQHVYLAIWRQGTFAGTYDERRGWRAAGRDKAPRSKRSISVQLAFAS
jgi:hypothetical protein